MGHRKRVKVWDRFIRLFHWSLAGIFLTNMTMTEEGSDWHQWLGYIALALLLLRLIWGFIGSESSRWHTFWPGLTRLQQWYKGQWHPPVITHTPPGALMMITLMLLILGLGITGYMMEEIDYFWGEDWVEELHGLIADSIMLLIPLHVLAAIRESWQKKDNLITGMIHGYRRLD
ncbi:cytochrome b/b6 domain-containing protein [Oceanospirillum sediminis]|uniref:Cytochrome b/b6 domain-containing protein n=1 Tax=Oceanospirillum sediminis TaxID=2760088 RepID=A0A839IW53_9GAMM|nr:cytochrome b/b6 domain-containing protein [Oceanospirillum sediminis]MBB1488607.1 cytochrome b/b6 domain-containing protein [Oceanospirillum sediminis]